MTLAQMFYGCGEMCLGEKFSQLVVRDTSLVSEEIEIPLNSNSPSPIKVV